MMFRYFFDLFGEATVFCSLLLVCIGVAICNGIFLWGLQAQLETITDEVRLNDKAAAARSEDLKQHLTRLQKQDHEFIMRHSTPIQLGSLDPDEVARLNVQLAMAIAANQGCIVSLHCDLLEEGP